MAYELHDKVSVFSEGGTDIDPQAVQDFSGGRDAVIIFVKEDKYAVNFISDEGDDWDWWEVPKSWVHDRGYAPPNNEFIVECKVKNSQYSNWQVCIDYEPFKDVMEAQKALESHRNDRISFDARLTYNGTVIG